MDSISSDIVLQSVQALNQVLQAAQAQSIELAEKMVQATLEIKLGAEAGKGALLDIVA